MGEEQVTATALPHNVLLRVTDPPSKCTAAVLTSCMLIVIHLIPQILHLIVVNVLCEHCTAVAAGPPALSGTALPIAASTLRAPGAAPGCWPCSRQAATSCAFERAGLALPCAALPFLASTAASGRLLALQQNRQPTGEQPRAWQGRQRTIMYISCCCCCSQLRA